VNFTIRPLAGVASGTPVLAQATVRFDINAPLETNVVTNRVDATPPVSAALATVGLVDSTLARVRWSGDDSTDGSGLRSVAVYVKHDGDPFQLLGENLTGDSLTVAVQPGHRYAFYTVATDNAGNSEAGKSGPEAWIGVPVTDIGPATSPTVFALHPAFPNPSSSAATLRFDLPVSCRASLEVFDVAGRRVATPMPWKVMPAGRHVVTFRGERLSSGLYFYRLRAGGFERTRRMAIVR
jgi:hypothetical protein